MTFPKFGCHISSTARFFFVLFCFLLFCFCFFFFCFLLSEPRDCSNKLLLFLSVALRKNATALFLRLFLPGRGGAGVGELRVS